MKRFCFLLMTAVSLSACGLAVRMEVRDEMNGSKAAYKSCLAENPKNISACEALRLAYEADLKAFQATAGGASASRDLYDP